jgi:TonB-dependent starch-binding outer membrane protein SusC
MQLLAKSLAFALCFLCFQLARGQLISFSVTNQPLEKVLLLIEQQSGYNFIYSTELIATSKPVTAQCKNEQISRALDLCFRNQPLTYSLTDRHVIIRPKQNTPDTSRRNLQGSVINEQNEPMAGVSVIVKGTSNGTTTNSNGEFFLRNVPATTTLVISGVSIEPKELLISAETLITITVALKSTILDQSIVIGYGIGTKRNMLESVSKVKGEDLTKQPVGNPILALSGRVAGLLVAQASGVPGGALRIQLRGRNSLVNGNDPLYIVDGVPFPSSPLNESFSGGGISASPLDNINPATIESIEVLKDAAATAIYGSRGANGVILITTKKASRGKTRVTINAYTGAGKITRPLDLLSTPEFLLMRREAFANDGSTPTVANAPDLKLWDTTRSTDWQKVLIGNTSTVNDINASVSFGGQDVQLLAATGYRRESLVFPGNFYTEKISGMVNATHSSRDKKLDLSISLSFLNNRSILPREDLTAHIKTPPNAPEVYTAEGNLNWENSSWINPFAAVMQTFSGTSDTWQSSLQFGYHILPGLRFRMSAGFTSINQLDRFYLPLASYNPASSPIARSGIGRRDVRTAILEPQLTYERDFYNRHRLELLLGSTAQLSNQKGLYQQASGYTSDDLLRSFAAAATVNVLSESAVKYRYAAVFARLQYQLLKRYLLTVSARRDGSSRYGPANRFSNFGSIGIGWILTSEKWMQGIKFLDFAKIRLSTGTTGNDQIGDYKYMDLYGPSAFSYQGVTTFLPVQLYSPAFGWENVRKWEAGVDFTLLRNRINITVNYFYNTTTNQLVNYTLPFTTGFSGVLRNIPATIRNTGLEVEGTIDIIKGTDWSWTSSINITVPRNKLVAFENFETSTYATTYVIGKPVNIVKTYTSTGVDPASGLYSFVDYNNDGRMSTPSDQQQAVVTSITSYGGWENTLTYKNFSFSAHVTFAKQPLARNYLFLFSKPGSIDNQPAWVLDRWQKPGSTTDIQRFTSTASAPNLAYNNFRQSNAAYSDASFIRLRNMQFAYQWQAIKFYVAAQNVALWTRYKGLDPETTTLLPPIRMITGGIQVNL